MDFADLQRYEHKVYSQNGEDGVLGRIFALVGVKDRYLVEFGCGDATECNAAYLLEQGWRGLLMDGAGVSKNPRAAVRREVVTAENINGLFQKYGVPPEFDLLSVDIDGNDFWVWNAIACRARVVVIEYNSHVPPAESRVIAYDPAFRWNGSDYYGASLKALAELGRVKGYQLVCCERTGTNAFFVADELLPPWFAARPLEEVYRPPNFLDRGRRHRPDNARAMVGVRWPW